ncbi:hypothetical protein OROGR_027503 [Orobanche gracilis]
MVSQITPQSTDVAGGEPQQTASGSANGGAPPLNGSNGTGSVPNTSQSGSAVMNNSFSVPVNHADKPEKFNGQNFKRWQQKMMFYLTTLGLSRFLKENPPEYDEHSEKQTLMVVDAWKTSDYLRRTALLTRYTTCIVVQNHQRLYGKI